MRVAYIIYNIRARASSQSTPIIYYIERSIIHARTWTMRRDCVRVAWPRDIETDATDIYWLTRFGAKREARRSDRASGCRDSAPRGAIRCAISRVDYTQSEERRERKIFVSIIIFTNVACSGGRRVERRARTRIICRDYIRVTYFRFHDLQEKRMVVFVEASVLEDPALARDHRFQGVRDRLQTFRDGTDDLQVYNCALSAALWVFLMNFSNGTRKYIYGLIYCAI